MPGKINRELVEITEALDGVLHRPVLTVSALRRLWLLLPVLGSCLCLLLLNSLPLWATNQSSWSPKNLSLSPFPFQDAWGAKEPSLPCSPTTGHIPGASSQGQNQESVTKRAISCPAAFSARQKGSNYRRTVQRARGRRREGHGALRSLLAAPGSSLNAPGRCLRWGGQRLKCFTWQIPVI